MAAGAVPPDPPAGHGRQRHRRAARRCAAGDPGRRSGGHPRLARGPTGRHPHAVTGDARGDARRGDGRGGARRVRRDDQRPGQPARRAGRRADPRARWVRGARRRRWRRRDLRGDPPPARRHPVRRDREEHHRRWHVVGEPLPRCRRRHAEPPVLVLVRPVRLVDVLRAARRAALLPRARRRPLRPATPHPLRHEGRAAGVRRRRPVLGRHPHACPTVPSSIAVRTP